VKSPVIILLAGVSYAATAVGAEARCYSRWYYPWKQTCGVYARSHTRTVALVKSDPPIPVAAPVDDIPLPDMSADWGGAMDTELELSLQRQKAIRQLTQQGN
jgi:hypothetical protein